MDEQVQKTLLDWGYSSLINVFKFHQVDNQSFFNLNAQKLKDIIPESLGCQSAFLNKYVTELIKRHETDNISVNTDREIDSGIASVLSNANLTSEESKNIDKSQSLQVEEEESNEVLGNFSAIKKLQNIDDLYTDFVKSRELYQLLKKSLTGRLILSSYAETNSVIHKRELANIVMERELESTMFHLNYNSPFSVNSEKFNEIVETITQLFPKENKEKYFTKGFKTVINDTVYRQRSSGFLVRAYDNLRDKLHEANLLEKVTKQNRSTQKRKGTYTVNLEVLFEENCIDKRIVTDTWINSYQYRHTIDYKNLSTTEVLNKYKILRTEFGSELILLDFETAVKKIQPSSDDRFRDTPIPDRLTIHWPEIAPKIIKLAKEKNDTLQFSKSRKRKSLNFNDTRRRLLDEEIFNDDHHHAVAFLLIPGLIDYSPRPRKDSHWIINENDISDSFIVHIDHAKTREQLQEFANERVEYYENKAKFLQAYVIFNGPLTSISFQAFSVIGATLYECKTPIEAIDLCFKLFISLNLQYSIACAHVWSFLQKYVYELKAVRPLIGAQKIISLIEELNREI